MAFGRRLERFLQRGGSGAVTAAGMGVADPLALAAIGVASGAPALLEKEYKFDPAPHRRAFKRFETGVRNQSRRSAAEAGSQTGAMLASQGIQGGLPAGIAAGNRRLAFQHGDDIINKARYQVETEIAEAEALGDAHRSKELREGWQDLSNTLILHGSKLAPLFKKKVDKPATGEKALRFLKTEIAEPAGTRPLTNPREEVEPRMSTRPDPDRPTLPAPKMQMPPLDKDLPPLQIQPPGGNIGGEPVGPLAVPTSPGRGLGPLDETPFVPGDIPGGPVELPMPDRNRPDVPSPEAPIKDRTDWTKQRGIDPDSEIGKQYTSAPFIMVGLEELFGMQFMEELFV